MSKENDGTTFESSVKEEAMSKEELKKAQSKFFIKAAILEIIWIVWISIGMIKLGNGVILSQGFYVLGLIMAVIFIIIIYLLAPKDKNTKTISLGLGSSGFIYVLVIYMMQMSM